ncbi:hypothetical protein [Natronomonas aquatica]|jgi:hypothetical protein|nr:hypothetical protein [Natronomonas aquatica]
MAPDPLVGTRLFYGILWTVLGVGFWVGGVVAAHYIWKRYRERE